MKMILKRQLKEVVGVLDFPVIVYSYETDRIIAMSSRAMYLSGGEIQAMSQLWEERKKQKIPMEILNNGSFILYGKHIIQKKERLVIDAEFTCVSLEKEHMVVLSFEQSHKAPFVGNNRLKLPRIMWRDKKLKLVGTNTVVRSDCDVNILDPEMKEGDAGENVEEAMREYRRVMKEGVGRYEILQRTTINKNQQSFAKYYRIPLINKYKTCIGVLTFCILIVDPKVWNAAKDEIYRANYILNQAVEKAGIFAVTWESGEEGMVDFISSNVREWGYLPEDFYSGRLTWKDIVVPQEYVRFREKNTESFAYATRENLVSYHIRKSNGEKLALKDITIQTTILDDKSYRQGVLEIIPEEESRAENLVPLLKHAAENEMMTQFSVYFQPIIESGEEKMVGVEALLRWYHPEYGFMNPAEFIPASEYLGYMGALSELVFTEAFSLCRDWNHKGDQDFKVHINLSAMQLMRPETLEQIRRIHRKTGVRAANIIFEVKESLASEGVEFMKSVLDSLRAQGFQILLDDFGSGISSLDLVTEIPLQYLKMDETFMAEYGTEKFRPDFLTAIVELAHNLEIQVVVSGIETKNQRDFLVLSDIDFYQGYFYGKPIPRKELEARLRHE